MSEMWFYGKREGGKCRVAVQPAGDGVGYWLGHDGCPRLSPAPDFAWGPYSHQTVRLAYAMLCHCGERPCSAQWLAPLLASELLSRFEYDFCALPVRIVREWVRAATRSVNADQYTTTNPFLGDVN